MKLRRGSGRAMKSRTCFTPVIGSVLVLVLAASPQARAQATRSPDPEVWMFDRAILVGLPKADELAGRAPVLGREIEAEVTAAAIVQKGHPAEPPVGWIIEVRADQVVEQPFGICYVFQLRERAVQV